MRQGQTIEGYLQDKYSAGGPGSERFDPVDDEVHSSQLSDCQRKRKWKHDRGTRADPSPYFELGRIFEMMYGAALAHEHDPGIETNDLKRHPPWEIVEMTTHVVQDVNVDIDLGGVSVVGECDWVVLDESCPAAHAHEEHGVLEEVQVTESGGRGARFGEGQTYDYEQDWVQKVVETKTTKDLDWKRKRGADDKHVYQVYPYMHALMTEGEIIYMQRNDWEELVFPLEYDADKWLDCVVRARTHARNQKAEENVVPPTSPLDDSECRWCDFSHECANVGGSRWEDDDD